jgi:predicted amidohydrolase
MAAVERYISQAAKNGAKILCFPESFIPGMRGIDERIGPHSPAALRAALESTQALAKRSGLCVILPMDWDHPNGISNVAMVISAEGELLGQQTKNQLDPTEDDIFVPGTDRKLFEIPGLRFGITICHEGFRYPESVRWAASRGAQIVFHPQATGSNYKGRKLTEYRGKDSRFFEHAMHCRAVENTIFFASVNYAFAFQESATSVVAPSGECLGYQPYGEAGLLVVDLDPGQATGQLARRFKASGYS